MNSVINHVITGTDGPYETLAHRYFAEAYQGSVEFRGLPECSLYILDLYLIVDASGLAYGPALRFNGDAGNNYQLNKASLTSTPNYSQTALQSYFEIGSLMGTPEGAFMRAMISGGARPSLGMQHVSTYSYTNGSGAGDIHYHSGYWDNGDVINRISIVPLGGINGTIGTGTYMTLYGMR